MNCSTYLEGYIDDIIKKGYYKERTVVELKRKYNNYTFTRLGVDLKKVNDKFGWNLSDEELSKYTLFKKWVYLPIPKSDLINFRNICINQMRVLENEMIRDYRENLGKNKKMINVKMW